jgi:L-alanine-DL-glutamate epimerase-like enolase superfamily enzyme
LTPFLLGKDPRAIERICADLYRMTRQSPGGIVQKAIAGIENALWDIKGKALGVPVYELLGGPTRDRIQLYWSHCGTSRVRAYQHVGTAPLRTLEDIKTLGREVVARGYSALKTNVLLLDDENPMVFNQGFKPEQGSMDQNLTPRLLKNIVSSMEAFREAIEPETGLILDLNFNFKPEGIVQVAQALSHLNLLWLELDCYDPQALRYIRDRVSMPICSGENLYTTRQYRPFFEAQAMDVAMVDIPWNGFSQSKKIGDMAEAHEINIAPHNFYSHLSTFISAHLCATLPNVRILEVDVDDVAWKDELVTQIPQVVDGHLVLSDAPGWGADLNEAVLQAHPWPKQKG